ncbi:MAG TPA: hypothetical protein VGE42_11305, partial [Candidatus Dormibacteraeota bacterium]
LARAGRWRGDETVVAYITGHGLKTAEVLNGRSQLEEAIPPSVRAFRERFGAAADAPALAGRRVPTTAATPA